MRSRAIVMMAAAATLSGLTASAALAVDKSWNTGTGNWGISANWNPNGVPTASDIVYLNFQVNGVRGASHINGTGFANPISISIRALNELDLDRFSALTIGGDVIAGYGASTGFLNVKNPNPGIDAYGSQITIGNTLRLGFGSSSLGIVTQNDGTVTVNQLVRVGDRHDQSPVLPGVGSYRLSGFGVLNANRLEVGYGTSQNFSCDGTFDLSGGTLNVSGALPEPQIGGNNGTGVFNQSGGTFNCPQRILVVGGSTGVGTYNYSGGTFNVPGISVNNTGVLNYNAGANWSVGQLQTVNGHVNMASGGGKVLRSRVLFTSAGSWAIDVNDNAMVVGTPIGEAVETALFRGRNGGAWNGTGINSTAAHNDPQHVTALALLRGAEYKSIYGPNAMFGGVAVVDSDYIVKYTYNGDINFNGKVDGADYARIDTTFNNERLRGTTYHWIDGDFDWNGIVDGADYALMDAAFNAQSGILGPGVTVPEPATPMALALLASFLGIARRRRQQVRTSAAGR